MSSYKLNSIETDYTEMGNPSEYENPIDRFVIWATVDFDINGDNHKETVVFDCGQRGDVEIWENHKALMEADGEQGQFLEACLQQAGAMLKELKKTLQQDAS